MRNMNRFFSNHGNLFLFAVLAVLLVIAAALFYKSFHNVEPYSNPAEHRKIRAKCRNQRRCVFFDWNAFGRESYGSSENQ